MQLREPRLGRVTRASRPVAALTLAAVLLAGGSVLGGCSVVRNAVDSASGGKVDIGGTSVPKDYPKEDVPLIDGKVVYGVGAAGAGGRVWNVTIAVKDRTATQAITTQLTGAGFTATASAGSDATGDTASFAKGPYSVIVAVSNPTGKSQWLANYTVTKVDATPTPTSTPAG